MSGVPEGAQRSDDGHWWWDGSAWQAVEDAWDHTREKAEDLWDWAGGAGDGGAGDGGLPPGGVPEQQVCDLGPCPGCWENDQMSAPCVHELGHGSQHQCANGDLWEQAGAGDAALPAGTPVATAILDYDSGGNRINVAGNTTGWPRGRIYVTGEVYCDGELRQKLERAPCERSTSCELPSWSTTPEPGTHWEFTVVGEGPRYSPVSDTAEVHVP